MLPLELRRPLIKRGAGKLMGLQSGRRSAVITNGKSWYRLKGCGSYGQGFPLEDLFPNTKKEEKMNMKFITG